MLVTKKKQIKYKNKIAEFFYFLKFFFVVIVAELCVLYIKPDFDIVFGVVCFERVFCSFVFYR